jgi:elongation factor 1-delta
VNGLQKLVLSLSDRVSSIESKSSATAAPVSVAKAPVAAKDSEDDDGVDLFGSDSDEDDEAAAAVKEKLLADYAAKKSKKPVLIAKSNIILDIKPWDDETDMKEMEAHVRKIECEGLLWGAAKLVPLAYGIHKLQISTVVVDDLVSVDWLIEELEKIEDFVQSVDIAAFNKI